MLFLISPDDFWTKLAARTVTKSLRIFIPDRWLDKKHHKYILSQTTLSPLYETSDNIELFSNLKYASSISRDFLKVLLYNPFDTLGFDKFFRALYFTSFPRRHNLTTLISRKNDPATFHSKK